MPTAMMISMADLDFSSLSGELYPTALSISSTMGVRAMAMTTLAATKLMLVARISHVTACMRTEVPTLLNT